MATTGKFMTLKSVKGIAATLSSDLDVTQLSKLVMDSLQQSPQMKMQEFSPRARFLTNISSEEVQRMLNDFLERLSKYYCILLVQERSRTNCDKYAAFQIHWLQSIKAIVTYGENLALNSGQIENDEMTKDELVLAEDVAGIILQSFDTQCDEKDILIMFQTIARVVFLYQKSSAVSLKEGEISEGVMHEEQIESDSDDTLLRVAGAQLHRMIDVRKEHLKRKDRTDESMATIRDELEFLKVISMDATQKGSLPVSLRSTELGGQIFPLMELIPFVKQIVDSVKREVNDDTFKRYGERLFQLVVQVTEMKLQCDKDLLELFYTCWRNAIGDEVQAYKEVTVKSCLDELVSKIVNLCKKDWEVSRKRSEACKGNDVTLNLRDKLKANIAK